jgi:hypothetical protein
MTPNSPPTPCVVGYFRPETRAVVGGVVAIRAPPFQFARAAPTCRPWINPRPAPPGAARSAASRRCTGFVRSVRSAAPTSTSTAGSRAATRFRSSKKMRARPASARTKCRSPHERAQRATCGADSRMSPRYARLIRATGCGKGGHPRPIASITAPALPSGPRRPRGPGAQVAQLVEHVTENHGVGGSIPPLGTSNSLR